MKDFQFRLRSNEDIDKEVFKFSIEMRKRTLKLYLFTLENKKLSKQYLNI